MATLVHEPKITTWSFFSLGIDNACSIMNLLASDKFGLAISEIGFELPKNKGILYFGNKFKSFWFIKWLSRAVFFEAYGDVWKWEAVIPLKSNLGSPIALTNANKSSISLAVSASIIIGILFSWFCDITFRVEKIIKVCVQKNTNW